MQFNGAGKSGDRSAKDIRRNAEGEGDTKRLQDRYETLRAIPWQGDRAADESSAIQRALEDLGGSQDPAHVVLGVAAAC